MSKRASPAEQQNERIFIRRALIVAAIAAVAFLLWHLRDVFVLLFGAVVIAAIIRALATPLNNHLRIPNGPSVLLAFLLILSLVAGVAWLLGAQLTAQTQQLADTLPGAVQQVDDWLAQFGVNHPIDSYLDQLHHSGGQLVSRFGGFVSATSTAVANFLIVVAGGVFLASEPRFYRTGAIKLVPPQKRNLIAEAMDECETALRLWLKGQLIAMVVIGAMTAAGLWLLGIESWLVLGLLAGFFEFIPFAGPILSALPGILIALVQSPDLALWTAGMYVIVQHSEAYFIQPLFQQYAVDVPAVVLLFSLLAFGLLFGALGILLAAPLTVVSYVLVKRLYVVEALNTPTPIPGEDKEKTA
jgi:predicted PurR-regulated permease PerM